MRNYRPITLLNSDYKIMTRILAKRMLSIVTQFVSDNQIGFVPYTFIAESAMLVNGALREALWASAGGSTFACLWH